MIGNRIQGETWFHLQGNDKEEVLRVMVLKIDVQVRGLSHPQKGEPSSPGLGQSTGRISDG